MIVIGLTGGLGTGKTTVARMFKALGADVIDADALAHESLKPGGVCFTKVVRVFGRDILEGRMISRRKLAEMVFRHPLKLKKLTAIIHPAIERQVLSKIKKLNKQTKRLVVIDAPLLMEAGWHRWTDYVIVVRTPAAVALRRVQSQRGITRAEVLRRMKLQMPVAQKIRMADIVIDNRKNINETQHQVEKIVQVLTNRM